MDEKIAAYAAPTRHLWQRCDVSETTLSNAVLIGLPADQSNQRVFFKSSLFARYIEAPFGACFVSGAGKEKVHRGIHSGHLTTMDGGNAESAGAFFGRGPHPFGAASPC